MSKHTTRRKSAEHQRAMQEIREQHIRELLSLPEIEKQEPRKLRVPDVPQRKMEERKKDSVAIVSRVPKETLSGQVYVVQSGETSFYKIGCLMKSDKTMDQRIQSLQIGNPLKLSIVLVTAVDFPFAIEGMLHDKFQKKWVRGEWYQLTPEDLASIPDLIAIFGVTMQDFRQAQPTGVAG